MDNESHQPEATAAGRLPWHAPEVRRLTVNIDTRYYQGSPTDGSASGSTSG